MSMVAHEHARFDNVLHAGRPAVAALATRVLSGVVLAGAWALSALPVVTWLAASTAVLHALDGRPRSVPDALRAFAAGWRRQWRRTVPLGTLSALVLAVLVANLLFLTGQRSGTAVVLAVGTLVLMLIWAFVHLALVPVVVLFPAAGPRRWVEAAFVVAFRSPVRSAGLVLTVAVLGAAAAELSLLLVPLCAPVVGHLAMRACQLQIVTGPGGTPALR